MNILRILLVLAALGTVLGGCTDASPSLTTSERASYNGGSMGSGGKADSTATTQSATSGEGECFAPDNAGSMGSSGYVVVPCPAL